MDELQRKILEELVERQRELGIRVESEEEAPGQEAVTAAELASVTVDATQQMTVGRLDETPDTAEEFLVTVPETVPDLEQPQQSALDTKSKRKRFFKEQKKQTERGRGLMSAVEMRQVAGLRESQWGQKSWMKDKIKGHGTVADVYSAVQNGDYSAFEKLPISLRNELATEYMNETFIPIFKGKSVAEAAAAISGGGTSQLLNPVMRLGISLAMRSGIEGFAPGYFRALDNELCRLIMLETLIKQPDSEVIERENLTKNPDIQYRNVGAQSYIAKNLLLAHLGQLKKVGRDGTTKVGPGNDERADWEGPVSAAFAHCSRVHYIMPPMNAEQDLEQQAREHKKMWEALNTLNHLTTDGLAGMNGGMYARGGSTHDLQRRRVSGRKQAREIKRLTCNMTGQMGMNVAIGGLGSEGIPGTKGPRYIRNDGTCGHIYSMRKEAEEGICGAYLIGFESDEYKKTNQLGHTHDLRATGEKASSFGGQRSDEIGAKYGGREVDLSEFTPQELTRKLHVLETVIRVGIRIGDDLTEIMEMLTGPVMSDSEMARFEALLLTKLESERYAGYHQIR